MDAKNLIYLNKIEQNNAKWYIYGKINEDDPSYVGIYVQKQGIGIIDMVIGVKFEEGWRDIAAGPIIDFINSTEGDPRYE